MPLSNDMPTVCQAKPNPVYTHASLVMQMLGPKWPHALNIQPAKTTLQASFVWVIPM